MAIASYAQIPRNNNFAVTLQYLKKKWETKLIFYMQISIKLSYNLILSVLVDMSVMPK